MTITKSPTFSGCGIVGSVHVRTSEEALRAMLDTMAHRGPDGVGTWTSTDGQVQLGHRRLAIVGPDERGAQPMTRGEYTVTCNGEIYNYHELRDELEREGHRFDSDSDTEVLLHAYAAWRDEFVHRLDGIFAFALHDARRRLLLLVRDPLGVKPLVYTVVGGQGLLFASEPKALLRHPLVAARPNLDAIRSDLIHELFGPKEATWFEGIHNLDPGTTLTIDLRTYARTHRAYWRPSGEPIEPMTLDEYAELVRDGIEGAVARQLLSDVGICATNSGGVDSSAITVIAARSAPERLDAFTVRYEGSAEPDLDAGEESLHGAAPDAVDRWHALRLLRRLPQVRPRHVHLRPDALLSRASIDDAVVALDGGPPLDLRVLAVAELYAEIRRAGHKVVLTGEGADEVWLGYYHVPYHELWRLPPERLSAAYLGSEYFPRRVFLGYGAYNAAFLNEGLARDLSLQHLARNYSAFPTDDPLNRLTYFAIRTHLQTLLNLADKMSMRSSVEARVPWVDRRLVELSLRIPGYVKLSSHDDNRAKALNRRALRGVLPGHILDRVKAQFPGPVRAFYDQRIAQLIGEDAPAMRRSPILREIFARDFLEGLSPAALPGPAAFAVYMIWRFGALYDLLVSIASMTTYLVFKIVHVVASSIWIGAAMTTPADVREALQLGPTHAEELLLRLRRTARWMNLAGLATLLSGIALILTLGGWDVVSPRIHLGLALTLLIFPVGRYMIRPSIVAIGAALREGTLDRDADGLASRLARGVWAEHALRLAVLLLMLVPFRLW